MILRLLIIAFMMVERALNLSQQSSEPQVFEPGIVSTDSSEFGSAFSADGNMFLFARSVNKRSTIFFSRKKGNSWSIPERVSFSLPGYADADPAFAPDGALYFISTRPTDEDDTTGDYDIWRVKPLRDEWSTPTNVKELNSPDNEFYISFASNGDAYFSSSRSGGFGEEDIYMSKRSDNTFLPPSNLGEIINSEYSEYDPFITSAGNAIIFTSSGRADSFGKGDLYWSVRSNDGWQNVLHFGSDLNTASRDYCPYITTDRRIFFFASESNVKFVTTKKFPVELLAAIRK